MNFIPLHLASGLAFFEGIAMVTVALLLLLRFKHRIVRPALRIIILVGIAAVAASSTPQPLLFQAIWCVLVFICMVLFHPGAPRARNVPFAIFLVVLSAGLCVWEATYRILPRINVAQGELVYVIGDSISAGLGHGETTWPAVLAQSTHLNIVNLARPGATLATAPEQVRRIPPPRSLVILEIGGNDLLNGVKPAYFRAQLDALLSSLRASGHAIVMFELPLLPFNNGIGEAQRSLAGKYHVILIPKRCLASVIGMEGGTVDGLHLSQKGHGALAQTIKEMLVIAPQSQ